MKTYTIQATHGNQQTPCRVVCAETRFGWGDTWFVIEGFQDPRLSPAPLACGIHLETIQHIDEFHWTQPIQSEEELENAINA